MYPSFFNFTATLILLSLVSSCSEEQAGLRNIEAKETTELTDYHQKTSLSQGASFFIYDCDNDGYRLKMVPVVLNESSGDILRELVFAFLNNNHFLKSDNTVSLLKIHQTKQAANFYFSNSRHLQDQLSFQLFHEALELTIMKHLKHKNFHIFYNETNSI